MVRTRSRPLQGRLPLAFSPVCTGPCSGPRGTRFASLMRSRLAADVPAASRPAPPGTGSVDPACGRPRPRVPPNMPLSVSAWVADPSTLGRDSRSASYGLGLSLAPDHTLMCTQQPGCTCLDCGTGPHAQPASCSPGRVLSLPGNHTLDVLVLPSLAQAPFPERAGIPALLVAHHVLTCPRGRGLCPDTALSRTRGQHAWSCSPLEPHRGLRMAWVDECPSPTHSSCA